MLDMKYVSLDALWSNLVQHLEHMIQIVEIQLTVSVNNAQMDIISIKMAFALKSILFVKLQIKEIV